MATLPLREEIHGDFKLEGFKIPLQTMQGPTPILVLTNEIARV